MTTEIEFRFEDLCGILDGQVIDGLKFSGVALLKSNYADGEGEPHEFYCAEVQLDGENIAGRKGLMLREKGVMNGFPCKNREFLYKVISAAVEADDEAQREFSEAVEEMGR
jgi:hypothetical protein